MDDRSKEPYVLILSHPLTGHITPMLVAAAALLSRGWIVGFLGPTRHRSSIESTGCEYFPLRGIADIDDTAPVTPPRLPKDPYGEGVPKTIGRVLAETRAQCYDTIPHQWACIVDTLATLHRRDALRRVVVLCEAFVHGILPMKCGAPLPPGVPQPETICVSVTPPMIRTRLQPPFYYALPYDPSPLGQTRAEKLWEDWAKGVGGQMQLYLDAKITEAGGRRGTGEPWLAGVNYTCHRSILQIGVPDFEYPRNDWPPGFKFIGLPPPRSRLDVPDAEVAQLPWWPEFLAEMELPAGDRARRKVVVVTQGTVEADANDLIIPTIEAIKRLSLRPDQRLFLVVILGVRNGKLPPDAPPVPGNVKVVDYLRYGVVLPHADVWVHNGGYGAVTQGIATGVPMIVAGEGQDKAENARRVGWSGIGIDLHTAHPEAGKVEAAVAEVLRHGSGYQERAAAMKQKANDWRFGEALDQELRTLLALT